MVLAIVDVGLGNVASVRNMLDRLGFQAELRSTPQGLTEADRYILPGVGSYDEGVRRLRDSDWFEHLQALPGNTHILGICLGMQLLGRGSDEGQLAGLGRVPVKFTRFDSQSVRVPHMGWNVVRATGSDNLLVQGDEELRFYFTHSFYAECEDESIAAGLTYYGRDFVSAYRRGNTRGVQFHPEKSHRFGMRFLSEWMVS